ncbi:hypothetical protein JW979_10180 [bacterium]|nr:hypothetical protein [candidate division CSSED10-310 bacterium]
MEIGGAIGLPLFLSQALSITLYSFGLAESFRFVWPEIPLMPTAAIIVVAITLLSLRSAAFALKAQIPIMIGIGLSIAALFSGVNFRLTDPALLTSSHPESPGFWVVFAVFFPAVTGILAGISMSGDLKDPQKAIPRGAIGAVLVGFAVYMSVPFILTFAGPDMSDIFKQYPGLQSVLKQNTGFRELLRNDSLVWTRIASFSWLIFPGLWGAILSSAIGSILSAPRTLQALAMDRIVPKIFSVRSKKNGEPWVALLFSSAIALLTVLLGDLNVVAPILTMFFLTTYGMVNLVAGLESLVGDPSYRPQLKIPWYLSLIGAIGCFWVMFLINKFAFAVALLIESVLWFYLRRRALQTTWGDIRRGFWMAITRYALIMLKRFPEKPRAWRPNILLFAGDVEKRIDLVNFANWFGQNKGLVTVCNMIVGSIESNINKIETLKKSMDNFLEEQQLIAFSEVDVVQDFETGILDITQSNGMAGLESNTLMFGWTEKMDRLSSYLRIMRQVEQLHKSMIICRINPKTIYRRTKKIDLWWGGQQRNGDLMLLLAHLLSLNPEWHRCQITIKSIARSDHEKIETESQLDKMIPEIRIECKRIVYLVPPETNVLDIIHRESRSAEVNFLGLALPDPGFELEYAMRLKQIVDGLGTTVLVRNSSMFIGNLVN